MNRRLLERVEANSIGAYQADLGFVFHTIWQKHVSSLRKFSITLARDLISSVC